MVVGAAAVLGAFLLFLTCFFATGAEESAGAGAAVCAASERPAVASVNENPSTAEVIFFMICPVLARRFLSASVTTDGPTINPL